MRLSVFRSMLVIVCVASLTSCRSGLPVLGFVSSWNADRLDLKRTQRALAVNDVPAPQKEKIIGAMMLGSSSEEAIPAAGVGINLAALARTSYTWGEIGSQVLSTIPDIGIALGAVVGGKALIDSAQGSGSDKTKSGISARTQTGNITQTYIVNQSGTVSSSSTGGSRDTASGEGVSQSGADYNSSGAQP